MITISGTRPLDLTSAMMMMTSGSVGITSTTLDSRLSASSRTPPAYPPLMPITTETTVASSPAPTPINSESRAPTTSWSNTSCPIWVVPSQCASDGAARSVRLSGFGLVTKNGPTIASSTKNPTMAVPTTSRGERKAPAQPGRRAGAATPGSAATAGDDVGRGHRDSLVRGSMKPCSRSTIRLAPSTAKVITRKIPCING